MDRDNPYSSGLVGRGDSQRQAQLDVTLAQPLIDLTNNDEGLPDDYRASKRQKLDSGASIQCISIPSNPSPLQSVPSVRATDEPTPVERPSWLLNEDISEPSKYAGLEFLTLSEEFQPICLSPSLPTRPWKYRPSYESFADSASYPDEGDSLDYEVQTVPFDLEIPEAAPILDSDGPLDFYPWKGHHPEDALTEQTSKQGYYDRLQVSQNESNTARPSLYTQFKHRSGLRLLSSVFTAILDKRQAHCKLAEASTFKPPPRVTLTDLKREAWLRDLANSRVPLRRLSRTIPHGVRGKVLLEQCINKDIPIERAVWLVKCVGANEIRAFRRKGTSTAIASNLEVKWVRDWTVIVQQFVECMAAACKTDLNLNVPYVARLMTRLFQEELLDQDDCLDWFLQSLHSSSMESLPVWLLLLRVYWPGLVRYRKKGRILAEYVLEKTKLALSKEFSRANHRVAGPLSRLLKFFVDFHPSCFVLPLCWRTYKGTLKACSQRLSSKGGIMLDDLSTRNDRILKYERSTQTHQQGSAQRVISLVDNLDSLNNIETLSLDCLDLDLDHSSLVSKILEWSSTSFRRGVARIYVAVRLLRKWRRAGIDTDSHIIDFIQQKGESSVFIKKNFYHVVSELVRSHSFTVGKYLQWLIARGTVTSERKSHPEAGLLNQIPRRQLPRHIWNLRNTLLAKMGFSADSEIQDIENLKIFIRRELQDMITKPVSDMDVEFPETLNLADFSWTVKSAIGPWLRDRIFRHRKEAVRISSMDNSRRITRITALTPTQFFKIRYIIECLEDFSLLADILKEASTSDDVVVLTSVADTLNLHIHSFTAMGALSDIFTSTVAGYSQVNKTDISALDLISSLLDVGMKIQGELSTVAMLRRDLSRFDTKFTVAASSPVSEHPSDAFPSIDSAFTETLQQLIASGTGMDEASINRTFDILIRVLQKQAESGVSCHESAHRLSLLRIFNTKVFDCRMVKWIVTTLGSSSRPPLLTFVPALVGVGCITLDSFFPMVSEVLVSSSQQQQSVTDRLHVRFEAINLLGAYQAQSLDSPDIISYRFKIYQEEYITQNACEALSFIDTTLMAAQSAAPQVIKEHRSVIPIISQVLIQNVNKLGPEAVNRIVTGFPHCADVIHQALDGFLGIDLKANPDSAQMTQRIVDEIDDFSMSYCLIKLRLLFDVGSDEDSAKDGIVDLLFKTAESDIREGKTRWLEVLNVLPVNAAALIRQRAESEFSRLSSPHGLQPFSTSDETALIFLRIVEELSYSIPDKFESSSFSSDLGAKMAILFQKTVDYHKPENKPENRKARTISPASSAELSLGLWYFILLRLVALHRSSLPQNCELKSELQLQTHLLAQTFCISRSSLFYGRSFDSFGPALSGLTQRSSLLNTLPFNWINLQLQGFDVCSALADTLPNESRMECARIIRERHPRFYNPKDPCLDFLLGPFTDSNSQPASSAGTSGMNITPQAPPTLKSTPFSAAPESYDDVENLRFQHKGRTIGSCSPRQWEMLGEAAPNVGLNDTPVSLTFFGARQAKGPPDAI